MADKDKEYSIQEALQEIGKSLKPKVEHYQKVFAEIKERELSKSQELAKVSPPGFSEETMHKLKNKYGTESAFKIAWAAHNKNSKAKKTMLPSGGGQLAGVPQMDKDLGNMNQTLTMSEKKTKKNAMMGYGGGSAMQSRPPLVPGPMMRSEDWIDLENANEPPKDQIDGDEPRFKNIGAKGKVPGKTGTKQGPVAGSGGEVKKASLPMVKKAGYGAMGQHGAMGAAGAKPKMTKASGIHSKFDVSDVKAPGQKSPPPVPASEKIKTVGTKIPPPIPGAAKKPGVMKANPPPIPSESKQAMGTVKQLSASPTQQAMSTVKQLSGTKKDELKPGQTIELKSVALPKKGPAKPPPVPNPKLPMGGKSFTLKPIGKNENSLLKNIGKCPLCNKKIHRGDCK